MKKYKSLFLLPMVICSLLPALLYCQWLEATIPVGNGPWTLIYNPLNNKVYCANVFNNNVTVIDKYNSVIKTIPVGQEPQAFAYNSLNNKVYCVNSNSSTVTVIDGASDTVIKTIPVGYVPRAIAYNSNNNKVYCANAGQAGYHFDSTVTVIDGETDSVITTVQVGIYPLDLVYNSINKKVYCANDLSNTVTVIDDTSNSVDTTITVGSGPRAFAWNPTENRVYVANYWSNTVSVIKDTIIVGIEEDEIATPRARNDFSIYPNPAKSFLVIRLPLSADRQTLRIFDVAGKVVKEIEILRSKQNEEVGGTKVSLKGINPGIYLLSIDKEITKFLVVR